VLSVNAASGQTILGEWTCGHSSPGQPRIDVIAHFSREDLELDRLVLKRFEGSETIANVAFRTLVDRYGGRPLAEYALAPREIDLS
jgi:hypothetical protein